MPEANTIGDRIRWLRKSQHISLRQLAEQVACDPGYLSKLESGKADNPSDRFLMGLVRIFRVSLQWLRSGMGDPYEAWAADDATQKALSDWSAERIGRVMAMLDDLPDALGTDAVLGELLRDTTPSQMQAIWRNLKGYADLPVTARLFWNDAFMRLQFTKIGKTAGEQKVQNQLLTKTESAAKLPPVKSQLDNLLADLNRLTKESGKKTELADYLSAPPASVSRWLSGEREPGGETTLKMLRWVQEQKSQPNALGSATNTTKGKTQIGKSSYEKPTQVRKKG